MQDLTQRQGLNPCFGGFGWESSVKKKVMSPYALVLILVLVDLGGKDIRTRIFITPPTGLNPCFGGFGWESVKSSTQPSRKHES